MKLPDNIEKIEVEPNKFVWVDKDAEIKEGDWFILFFGLENPELLQATKDNLFAIKNNCKKIIAASPELNLEGVPTYVEWLAKDYANNSAVTNYEEGINVGKYQGFIKGYQTAEKELPTWDDVRKAIDLAREGMRDYTEVSESEIIEQLKQQKQ